MGRKKGQTRDGGRRTGESQRAGVDGAKRDPIFSNRAGVFAIMKEFLLNSKIKTAQNRRGEQAGNLPSFPACRCIYFGGPTELIGRRFNILMSSVAHSPAT